VSALGGESRWKTHRVPIQGGSVKKLSHYKKHYSLSKLSSPKVKDGRGERKGVSKSAFSLRGTGWTEGEGWAKLIPKIRFNLKKRPEKEVPSR